MSYVYHPQTDGQTEVVNRSLEQYLRTFVSDRPHVWTDWLHLLEYWFNSNYHTSNKMTPFEALYGYPPPRLLDYVPSLTKVGAVDSFLRNTNELLPLLKLNLVLA